MRLVRWWIYAWVAVETWRKYRGYPPFNMRALSSVLKDVWQTAALEEQLYGESELADLFRDGKIVQQNVQVAVEIERTRPSRG